MRLIPVSHIAFAESLSYPNETHPFLYDTTTVTRRDTADVSIVILIRIGEGRRWPFEGRSTVKGLPVVAPSFPERESNSVTGHPKRRAEAEEGNRSWSVSTTVPVHKRFRVRAWAHPRGSSRWLRRDSSSGPGCIPCEPRRSFRPVPRRRCGGFLPPGRNVRPSC